MNIRDLATLDSARGRLEELIHACRVRGPLYSHDRPLTIDVVRKARGLLTSLTRLRDAANDPNHRPREEEERPVSRRQPLGVRLYQQRALYELARFVSYGGRRGEDVRAFMAGHAEKHGQAAASALHELTATDERTHLTVLRPEARRACRVLLGPAPESEEYEHYWNVLQKRQPPAEHQPPQDEPPARDEAPRKRKRKKADS